MFGFCCHNMSIYVNTCMMQLQHYKPNIELWQIAWKMKWIQVRLLLLVVKIPVENSRVMWVLFSFNLVQRLRKEWENWRLVLVELNTEKLDSRNSLDLKEEDGEQVVKSITWISAEFNWCIQSQIPDSELLEYNKLIIFIPPEIRNIFIHAS